MARAFELERRGNYAAAADAYRGVLASRPAEVTALLGLERVLLPAGRSGDILPQLRAALATAPRSGAVYGVALRAYAAADAPDSIRAVAERWASVSPGDETPFREWGAAALARRDRQGAATAYRRGREALHRPDALAAELAQLAGQDGDFRGALREWLPAIRRFPGYRTSAVNTPRRGAGFAAPGSPEATGAGQRPAGAPPPGGPSRPLGRPARRARGAADRAAQENRAAVEALRGLLDQLRTAGRPRRPRRARPGARADRRAQQPRRERARLRLDAARVYTSAGEREAARRMLVGIAEDDHAPGAVSAGASSTLVQVLIGEGKLDEAARQLAEHKGDMAGDDYAALQRRLVVGYVRAGDLARADSALGQDSTVDGLALAGRLRLYHGDVAGAIQRFKAAGPFAGDRDDATERTALLAMLQPIEADSLPELGAAMLALARGDTAKAVEGLERTAPAFRPRAAARAAAVGRPAGRRGRKVGGRRAAAPGRRGAGSTGHRAGRRAGAGGAAHRAQPARRRPWRGWST